MPKRVIDDPIREFAGTQVTAELTPETATNRRAINPHRGYQKLLISVTGSNTVRIGFSSRLEVFQFFDDSAGSFEDLLGPTKAMLDQAQTGTTSFTMLAADRLYLGTVDRIGGLRLTLDSSLLNNNASTMTAEYSSSQGGFSSTAITDGTISSSATLGQTENIVIDTVPAAGVWVATTLQNLLGTDLQVPDSIKDKSLYWLRLTVSADLDRVEIEQLQTLLRIVANTTGNADAGFFKNGTEYTPELHPDVGAIEFWSSVSGTSVIQLTPVKR